MPPDTPLERVDAVRRAFDAMLANVAFQEDARKSGMLIDPRSHAQIETMLKRISATPQDVIELARKAVTEE
jgi:tripartite-type tricarboxylate transporter receptor subunit TctC